MSHFPAAQWVDLVRGVASDAVRDALEKHVSEQCQECFNEYRRWQQVAEFAKRDEEFEPRSDVVRVVQSYTRSPGEAPGAVFESKSVTQLWVSATLTFDSLQAAPSGLRAASAVARHLLYIADMWAIDIHLEAAPKEGFTLLTGQIGNSQHPDRALKDLELALMSGNRSIKTFFTNELGEFQCEFERAGDLILVASTTPESTAIDLGSLFEPRNPNARETR